MFQLSSENHWRVTEPHLMGWGLLRHFPMTFRLNWRKFLLVEHATYTKECAWITVHSQTELLPIIIHYAVEVVILIRIKPTASLIIRFKLETIRCETVVWRMEGDLEGLFSAFLSNIQTGSYLQAYQILFDAQGYQQVNHQNQFIKLERIGLFWQQIYRRVAHILFYKVLIAKIMLRISVCLTLTKSCNQLLKQPLASE